jgi:hypothetical protein
MASWHPARRSTARVSVVDGPFPDAVIIDTLPARRLKHPGLCPRPTTFEGVATVT